MKTKNTDRLPRTMLADIKQNTKMGSPEFNDEEINKKTNTELFNHWLSWQGIIGWTGTIKSAVESIYGVKLEDK